MSKNSVGRPTSMTDEVVSKLEGAFAQGFSVSDACILADIARQTYYEYLKDNPKFSDRVEELRRRPYLASVLGINKLIKAEDPVTIRWYAERKGKDEFSIRNEMTGKGGGPVETKIIYIDKEEKEEYEKHIDAVINGENS